MPSKTKKHSKSGSKLSQSDQIPSSPQNSSNLTPNPDSELNEDQVLSNLEGISRKYPSLIGTTAFAGRVNQDAGPLEDSNGCKIWLSPSSMVASSITPGSVVSVSLASSRREISSHSPLSSLVSECARHYGFADEVIGDAGNYFALATVHPSCKVLKNGVRLSSNLSRSMGYPATGRIILVYPVSYRFTMESVNGIDRTRNGTTHFLSIHNCKDLYLALVSSRSGLMVSGSTSSHFEFLTERNVQIEDGATSSPKTPSFSQSKSSSPSTSHLNSPRYMKSLSNLNPYPEAFDSFKIKEVLGDESGRNVIQACIASCLCSRHLLCGSLVVIAVLSELCIFQVLGANKIYANKNNNHVKEESNYDLILTDPDIMNHVNDGFLVDHATKVHLLSSSSELEAPEKTHLELESWFIGANMAVNFPKLGGLSKEFLVLKDIITSSVKGTLSSFGLRPTKGVLLHGPPGTGKTSLARACAHDAGLNLFTVNGPEIVSQYHGESEKELDRVFKSAGQVAPAVVFIDELDAIAPSWKDGGEVLSQTMVATLLDLMDGISRMEGIVVIAATNRPDSIEPALRRPGRLDREIEIGVPSPDQRYDILLTLLREREHSLSDMEIQHLAQTTHGFVGADLAALCNEAAFCCLRRCIDQIARISCDQSLCSEASVFYSGNLNDRVAHGCSENLAEMASGDNWASSSSTSLEFPVLSEIPIGANINGIRMENILSMSYKDFEKAKVKVRPSAMREVILEIPRVSWQDIGGQEEVKLQLIEAVEWPQKHQDAFKRIGTSPPTGVLLFGPPGCSKTLLARAVASESGLNFLAVKGPELYSKWVGESEKAVKSLFAKASANAPSIIFFDELDGLAVIRGKENDGSSVADRVMSQLLVELNGLRQRVNVTVIAATNRPDKIDLALLRPGRFDRLVYVGPPNEKDRKKIFNVHLGKRPCSSDVCIEELARMSEGYTGADIALICRRAAIAAIEEHPDAKEIAMKHLKSAIEHVQPSEIESYDELSAKFQRLVSSATSKDDFDSQQYSRRSSWISSWYLRKFIDFCFSLLRGASSQAFSRR